MTHIESPKVVKKKLFSPIWLLPIVALILGGWLGFKSIRESGIEIQIHFPNATGIDVGKTLVKYQGLTVGKVSDISIDDDLKGVNVKVLMDYRADPFLRKDTLFWLVTPKASITGVEGLDALFSGNYIALQPGSGRSATQFEAERETPSILPSSEGLVIELTSHKLGSIDVGSQVFYHQIPVGSVVSYRLENSQLIVISVFIQEQYAQLVKKNSRFWNVSGVSIDASLSGIKINTESLASMLAGGISFDSEEAQALAENGDSFLLFADEAQATTGHRFTLTATDGENVSKGADIIYRGINVGKIIDKKLSDAGVTLTAELNAEHQMLLNSDSRFWLSGAEISLSGVKHAARLITGNVINILPGVSTDKSKNSFVLESSAPDLLWAKKRFITVVAKENNGVKAGSQLRFRQLPIGQVNKVSLSKNFEQVEYQVEILPEFAALLTQGSYFIPESALNISASLEGVQVQTRDLTTLVDGAISLIPGSSKQLAKQNQFTLFASNAAAQQEQDKAHKTYLTLTSQDGADLSAGAPIYYKKMAIGEVESIIWQAASDTFSVKLAIDKKFNALLKPNRVFWRNQAMSVDASLAGIELDIAPLAGAIKGSISLGFIDISNEDANTIQQTGILYEDRQLALVQAKAISLTLPASAKVTAKAPIRYQGHQIGQVQSVKLSPNLEELTAKAYLYGEYAQHFSRSDSEYFVVDALISLSGIKAPETLLTGPYIGVTPGSSTDDALSFAVQSKPRHYANLAEDALTFTLEDKELGSLKTGSQIFYRGIAIGQIDGVQLNAAGNKVQLFAHIQGKYAHLVNQTSLFWNTSGIKIDVGLFSGAQIETGSLETILAGGINVVTQDVTQADNALASGSIITLQQDFDPQWLTWEPAQQAQ
ncbi:PqiB family protein [Shewanella sp. SR44-3]|uniref:PqiB family protein n=1 Tax=Shewanella sp. SR44-3 TaxID=2760936 RepID=UPI0015F847CB|nr:MlaD family protein [Shewanella sp. SR44-3]MBB1267947.1 MCE family protein [Shewanella sp. SR44-3]